MYKFAAKQFLAKVCFLKNEALNETILLYSRFLTISNALNLCSFADTRDN